MILQEAAGYLLENACPAIRYRVRAEVLGEVATSPEMVRLQAQILQDAAVRTAMAWQQPDGYLGTRFHTAQSSADRGTAEVAIRLLCEKGVSPDHPVLWRALEALSGPDETFARELLRVGRILDESGLGGSRLIRAAVFARAGAEDRPLVAEQVALALQAFEAALGIRSISDLAEEYRRKWVFRAGARWPNLYHLRLLAFTRRWRTAPSRDLLARSLEHMAGLLPLPAILVRHRGQLVAPAGNLADSLAPDPASLSPLGWLMWFQRLELLARLGVAGRVAWLRAPVEWLAGALDAGAGRFRRRIAHGYFARWTAYTGLALERDWRSPQRRISDLTFRSLLILHHAGWNDSLWPLAPDADG